MEVQQVLELAVDHLEKEFQEARDSETALQESEKKLSKFLPLSDKGFKAANELLISLPSVMREYINVLMKEKKKESHIAAEAVFGYLFSRFDIISGEDIGYYGYIDDAIFAFRMAQNIGGNAPPSFKKVVNTQRSNLYTVLKSLPEGLEKALTEYVDGYYNSMKQLEINLSGPKNTIHSILSKK